MCLQSCPLAGNVIRLNVIGHFRETCEQWTAWKLPLVCFSLFNTVGIVNAVCLFRTEHDFIKLWERNIEILQRIYLFMLYNKYYNHLQLWMRMTSYCICGEMDAIRTTEGLLVDETADDYQFFIEIRKKLCATTVERKGLPSAQSVQVHLYLHLRSLPWCSGSYVWFCWCSGQPWGASFVGVLEAHFSHLACALIVGQTSVTETQGIAKLMFCHTPNNNELYNTQQIISHYLGVSNMTTTSKYGQSVLATIT